MPKRPDTQKLESTSKRIQGRKKADMKSRKLTSHAHVSPSSSSAMVTGSSSGCATEGGASGGTKPTLETLLLHEHKKTRIRETSHQRPRRTNMFRAFCLLECRETPRRASLRDNPGRARRSGPGFPRRVLSGPEILTLTTNLQPDLMPC